MVQWSNLPLELVEVIESKITSYRDKVRIRMVCKSWRSRLPILHQHAWLLYKPYGKTEGLYNPIDKNFYQIDLRYAKEKYIKGCSYGWVAIHNDNITELHNPARWKIYLINMFTNAHVSLPSTEVIPHHKTQLEIRKIVLSSPIADKNCIAVALYNDGEINYCKCGDKTWKYLCFGKDVIFHEGKLFVLCRNGELYVAEIGKSASPKFVTKVFKEYYPIVKGRMYLVKPSTGGGIIVVHVKEEMHASPQTSDGIELYKIDWRSRAIQIDEIGNNNLFLLDDTSAMMVSTTGDERNQIYMVENDDKLCLRVFNLENNTVRVLSDSKISSEVLCYPKIWVK